MSMLQYRHKSRAWLQMVTADDDGHSAGHQGPHRPGHHRGHPDAPDRDADLDALLERLRRIRDRLETRFPGLPDDATLRAHLEQLSTPTLHTLVVGDAWDSASVGGEEVDVDWLLAPMAEGARVAA